MALTYSEINTVSTQYFDKKIKQQVYDSFDFLKTLKKNNKVRISGGNQIQFPVRYRRLDRADAVGWGDQMTLQAKDTRTAGVLDWAPYRGDTMITWEQRTKNGSGRSRIVNLAEDKSKELVDDITYKLASDLWATSSVSGHIIPLATIVDEGDTYAGIAVDDAAAWAGYEDTTSTKMTRALFHSAVMEATWGEDGGPKRHYTTRAILADYATLLSTDERYIDADEMNTGTTSLALMRKPVIADPYVPSGDWYGLDMNEFELFVHEDNDLEPSEWFDARDMGFPKSFGKYVTFVANLVCRTRRVNFKLTALTGT